MKKLIFTISLLLIASLFTGCAPSSVNSESKDDLGRPVIIKEVPQRIISLAPSNTELLFALGLGSKVVATDDFSDYPPEAKKLTHVGSAFPAFNIETIVSLKPDLVVAFGYKLADYVTKLNDLGIPVVVFAPADINGIINNIEFLGKITGVEPQAEKLASDISNRLNTVTVKTKDASKPRVFWEFDSTDPGKPWTAGPGSFNDVLITLAGGINVGANGPSSSWQMNTEEIIKTDPEVIIVDDFQFGITVDSINKRPGWNVLSAVKKNAVYPISDPNLTDRPGPRIIDGCELLVRLIHPELFK